MLDSITQPQLGTVTSAAESRTAELAETGLLLRSQESASSLHTD
jgi:hypothetical protein